MTKTQKEPSYLYDVSPIFAAVALAAMLYIAWAGEPIFLPMEGWAILLAASIVVALITRYYE